MTAIPLALLFLLGGPAQAPAGTGASTGLAAAEALYASAAYEDALSQLAKVDDPGASDQVEQYRALCLLALGRTDEAKQSLERIVSDSPFYEFTAADVSPRLVAMFHEVRAQVLPSVAKSRYTEGKTLFDAKRYAEAARRFHDLLAILADDDVAPHAAELGDLQTLAQGFVTLADAAIPPAPTALTPAAAPVMTPIVLEPERIYSVEDTDVTPPADLDRRLPPWNPPNRAAVPLGRGILDLLIDAQGRVLSAQLRAPISPFYDDALLAAARTWRFRPATRNGEPVKYLKRLVIRITQ